MGKLKSLRSKAVHFVSDLTTVFLNPISDKPSSDSNKLPPSDTPPSEDVSESKRSQMESIAEEDAVHLVEGPDTSSFTAFLYSLLSSSESGNNENSDEQKDDRAETGKKSLLSRGKQSVRAVYQIARLGGRQSQEQKVDSDMKLADKNGTIADGHEMKCTESVKESITLQDLPGTSEPSLLLSEQARNILYASLPAIVQGRKWLLLYSTWRHGISLSTLYRRSMLWPGLSLLVVGDQKGAVFGGLVEAPLRPTNKRKYQGTNSTFVFTDTPGQPVIFRPTGANRYFTLCSTDFIAIGGGGHFALYLDADLLNGSSAVSETYGNPCLANSEDFEIKQVELWGFVHGSKYDEILALSRTEVPGICRW